MVPKATSESRVLKHKAILPVGSESFFDNVTTTQPLAHGIPRPGLLWYQETATSNKGVLLVPSSSSAA